MNEIEKSRFLALYCMVLADGVIDQRELETLYRIGIENYGFTPEQIAACIHDSGTSFILPTRLEEKISLLYQMAIISVCDDDVDDAEISVFNRYALKMGFKEENLAGMREFLYGQARDKVPQEIVVDTILKD